MGTATDTAAASTAAKAGGAPAVRETTRPPHRPSTKANGARQWKPLCYPQSALWPFRADNESPAEDRTNGSSSPRQTITNLGTNRFFPLHRDILQAATRELLLLDCTLDARSFTARTEQLRFVEVDCRQGDDRAERAEQDEKNPQFLTRYRAHLQSSPTTYVWVERRSEGTERSNELAMRQPRKRPRVDPTSGDPSNQNPPPAENGHDTSLPSAEAIVDILVQRIVEDEWKPNRDSLVLVGDAPDTVTHDQGTPSVPPRKVSDVDRMTSRSSSSLSLADFVATASCLGPQDLSHFVRLSNDGTYSNTNLQIHQDNTNYDKVALSKNDLLETSIAMESTLRSYAYQLTNRLTSHALFAWEQTEREWIRSAGEKLPSSVFHDTQIRDALFDARILRRLGGWEPWSLLPQAVTIQRNRNAGQRWQDWAKTTTAGKQLVKRLGNGDQRLRTKPARRGPRVSATLRHQKVICTENNNTRNETTGRPRSTSPDQPLHVHSSLDCDTSNDPSIVVSSC
ncbi:predicted protein [Phaeodactylum tricornutum CCAP 1055/1]|uniref:Uncharacterized protein n=1 Tax=Phaeodactylum tricornutum (strain CCAP 1055/1) TaxID=556484 RepID=B7GAP3_PHATC|nr:predicted protein [Phaeodactylum tricornutum CCAP 1055/1]EEC44407.1 predicted protein [Phaeodactylum tricornutum CCAP 1055/1]|eukprot:XP_002184229.1 predicted protein [Phaeodactylum tricornutum CCAP 1055/1]